MSSVSREELKEAMKAIEKLADYADNLQYHGPAGNLCGYCLMPLDGKSQCMPMEDQNPNQVCYCMDCHDLLRAYEESFAYDRLVDRAPMLAKSFIKKEAEASRKRFVEKYIEYIIDNDITVRHTNVDRMCAPYGGYEEMVARLDAKRKEYGWPRLIKEKKGKKNDALTNTD